NESPSLFLSINGRQAARIELQQVAGIVLRFILRAAVKACAGCRGLAVVGGGGDELHHVQGNILIPARADHSCKRIHGSSKSSLAILYFSWKAFSTQQSAFSTQHSAFSQNTLTARVAKDAKGKKIWSGCLSPL